jgi:adenosylmethionine-8-amino-7-oxononanoate aminotransferase
MHRLVARCAQTGKSLFSKTAGLLSHPHVGDIRGKGLFIGVEFVNDKKSKKPFPRKQKYVENFMANAMDKGLIFWWNAGQADGHNGDLIILAPPYIIGEKEISVILERMTAVLSEMAKIF